MMEEKVKKTIELFKSEILDFIKINPYLFLGGGASANSLFLFKYATYFGDEKILDLSLNEFEKVYNTIDFEKVNSEKSLIAGYTGVAWLNQYFVSQDLIEIDHDLFAFFDRLIFDFCKKDESLGKFDLFYGILGYGVYFLQRSKYNKSNADFYLNEIVNIMSRLAIRDSNGVFWNSDVFSEEKDKVNLGMAHGIPSIISFLAKVYKINGNDLAKNLGNDCVLWLLSKKSPIKESLN